MVVERKASRSFVVMAAMHARLIPGLVTRVALPISPLASLVTRVSGLKSVKLVSRSSVVAARAMAGGKLSRADHLQVYDDVPALTVSLAAHVANVAAAAIEARGAFSVVLSGGSLIKTLGFVLLLKGCSFRVWMC